MGDTMPDNGVLVELAGKVGEVGGIVKEIDRKNDRDHKEIKASLKDGIARFEEIEKRCQDHEGRLCKVEKDVEKVRTMSYVIAWFAAHPKTVAVLTLLLLGPLLGWSLEELLKIIL